MLSTTSFDNAAAMLPASCFYPPSQPPKWVTNDEETINRFTTTVEVKYPSSSADQQFRYQPEMRWPTEFPYQFQFTSPTTVNESCPTDPFPSTSVALPNAYKMDPTCYYPNTIIPSSYAATTPTGYFTASHQLSQWKVIIEHLRDMPSSVHSAHSIKSNGTVIRPPVNVSTTAPPYRTGPGTNNVRVRTSEKYRMVYTDFQRLELEKEFRTTQFINSERKSQLSTELQLTERQIKIWFQNRCNGVKCFDYMGDVDENITPKDYLLESIRPQQLTNLRSPLFV
ncbi:unnamed protein product [Anisakis simplex]|uniref:Homeobox protein pal-1 (inferred by orthology to a C. elegans protein) n=1 Tax=Anisakis simplex TaxID=6269 RepID=A0A0M3K3N9_ANISI|nr:unnamed protein product [Anisakis simplex]